MCDNICSTTEFWMQTASTDKALRYIRKRDTLLDRDERDVGEAMNKLLVICKGTKLMERLRLPTVLIRVCNGVLDHSKVYYVILELDLGKFTKRIAAVMFSDPSSAGKTQCAELLPLSIQWNGQGINITPLLFRTSYKKLFGNGCYLKVLALSSGRYTNSSETIPWNQRNTSSTMRSIMTELLRNDILKMPASLINTVTDIRATHTGIQSYSSNFSFSHVGLNRNNSCQRTPKCDLSAYYPSLRFAGVAASGGSSFAKWFKLLPPDIRVDTNFKCDRGTTLRRDTFRDTETFIRYLCKA